MSDRSIKRLLLSELNKELFPDNSFYVGSGKVDAQGADQDVVTVNESQERPTVKENPKEFPLNHKITEDAKKEYSIDLIATTPTVITDENELLVNYNKRANEMGKHSDTINTQIAAKINFLWSQTDGSSIVRTTGAGTGSLLGAMTGTRKAITRDDIVDVSEVLGQQEVPMSGRVGLIDVAQYHELLKIDDFVQFQLTGNVDPLFRNGALGHLMGITFFLRNGVTFYSNDATPVKQDYLTGTGALSTPVAASNLSAMIWHPDFVRYSLGNSKVFMDVDKPEYLGTALNASVRAGAMISRIDLKGVVQLVQTTV